MYQVLLEWYSPQQGGRQQPPIAGRYFATTYLNQLHLHQSNVNERSLKQSSLSQSSLNEMNHRSMWSISLLISASSIYDAALEFLVDTYPKVIQVGDLLPILEGTKTVGIILILSVIE